MIKGIKHICSCFFTQGSLETLNILISYLLVTLNILNIIISILRKTCKETYCKCSSSVPITSLYISKIITTIYFLLTYLLHTYFSCTNTYPVLIYLLYLPLIFINTCGTISLYLNINFFEHFYIPKRQQKKKYIFLVKQND